MVVLWYTSMPQLIFREVSIIKSKDPPQTETPLNKFKIFESVL